MAVFLGFNEELDLDPIFNITVGYQFKPKLAFVHHIF